MLRLSLTLASFCCASAAHALEIRIDYTYDTGNFFDTPEKRDAIESVAKFYSDLIEENLLAIDESEFPGNSWIAIARHPATGEAVEIPGLLVPEDVVIVFVGARELGGSVAGRGGPGGFNAIGFAPWFARIRGRGSSGAESPEEAQRTDYSLWGGTIAFDTPRAWNFSQSENQNGTEFITIALHEMGHVLGIGTAATWDNQLVSGNFTGPAVVNSYGSAPPADGGHFLNSLSSPMFGAYSATHGAYRPVLMLPGSTDTGSNFDVATDMDLAALVDIGWELDPAIKLTPQYQSSTGFTLFWNSVSFKTYTVERGTDLNRFPDSASLGDGDGTLRAYNDPAPPPDKAFYRIVSNTPPVQGALSRASEKKKFIPEDGEFRTIYVAPVEVENCYVHEQRSD